MDICRKQNISPEIVNKYNRLKKEIEPHKKELSDMFSDLMINIGEGVKFFKEVGFTSGKLNIKRLVKKFGPYFANKKTLHNLSIDDMDVYDQKDFVMEPVIKPDVIRVSLLLDCSGSMDQAKRDEIQKISILLMESFEGAEDKINLTYKPKKKIQIDTQIIAYGTDSKTIKDFSKNDFKRYGTDTNIANKWEVVDQLDRSMGSTGSDQAWDEVLKIADDPDYMKEIQECKTKHLCIEVTDGGADYPERTKNIIEKLDEIGLINRGIQIMPSDSEQGTFQSIWGKSTDRGRIIKDIL